MKLEDVKAQLSKDQREGTQHGPLNYLNMVTPERDLISVEKLRCGDTFFHKVVGGKSRPWVALWLRKGYVGCATLTHSNLEKGYETQCRFWRGNWIGPTLTILPVERVQDAVYFPYTNLKHLKSVRDQIKKEWCF